MQFRKALDTHAYAHHLRTVRDTAEMTPCPIYPYGGRIRRRPYPRCTLHGLSVTDLPHPEDYTAMPCRLCMRFHMYKHSVFF